MSDMIAMLTRIVHDQRSEKAFNFDRHIIYAQPARHFSSRDGPYGVSCIEEHFDWRKEGRDGSVVRDHCDMLGFKYTQQGYKLMYCGAISLCSAGDGENRTETYQAKM